MMSSLKKTFLALALIAVAAWNPPAVEVTH